MSDNGLSPERLTWIYTQMIRIREFEERVKGTFEEHPGVIRGHTHLADGAEASIVGSLAALGPDDQLTATVSRPRLPDRARHRHKGADGRDLRQGDRDLQGATAARCTSSTSAAGSSGRPGSSVQGIPHAAGAAWAAQIRGKGQVVLSFFGDGASKQGAFHETLNIASLWKLPVVFVMENNNYQAYTRVEQEDANAAAGEPLAVKAKAYSMPGVTVDGGDPVAVHDVVREAVERARSGEGPHARGVARLPAERPRQHHRPARRAAALPGARGDPRLRQRRGVRGGEARRPRAALPRTPRDRRRADRRGGRRDRRGGAAGDAGGGGVRAESPFPAPEKAVDYVYA
jgi:TPP-dependent pyruvate/acetoin dehydrogenase alpha subunit